MIHFRGIASQIIVFLLVTGAPAAVAVPKKPPLQQTVVPTMSVCQARRTIKTGLQQAVTGNTFLESQPSGIEFLVGELKFQAEPQRFKKEFPNGTYRVDLKSLGPVTLDSDGSILINGKWPLLIKNRSNSDAILGFLGWQEPGRPRSDFKEDRNASQSFANALNALRIYARNYDASHGLPPTCYTGIDEQARIWAEFQKRAAAWRALPAKPPISDDVKQHRLLAEDAFNQKQFDTAAAEYEAGLEIDPHWAQGHFNAALIYGELKDYDDAIWHMRCYLELTPDAPDAQEARDQMLLWQGKARQLSATQ